MWILSATSEGDPVRTSHTKFNPIKTTVLAAALALVPAVAFPAGLGKLNVLSGLGQPLRAEVDVSATNEELSSLSAKLASPEAFKNAGMEFNPSLAGIKFAIAKRPDGRSVVRMTSDRAINEPFVDLLIELNWATGRIVREYTFLLDPPEAVVARQAAAPVAPPVAARPEARPSRVDDETRARARQQTSAAPAAAPAGDAATTRTVNRGDTLSRIASATKPDGVTLDQMLVALFRNNKDAFDGNNMHRLRAGKILNIPNREAVAAVAPDEARRTIIAQTADFNAYRQRLAGAVAAAPAPKEQAVQQEATGKVAARVEDTAPKSADSKDQLKVSKAEAAKDEKAAAKADKAAQNRIAVLEEDLIAKDKALKEATSRLVQVEQNIKEMQKLIELKNKSLAELQKQAAAKPEPKAEPKPAELAPAPATPAPAAPVAAAPTPAPAPAPAPEAAKPEEKPAEKPVEKPAEPAAAPVPAPQPPAEAKPEEPKPEEPKPQPKVVAEVPKKPVPTPESTEPSFLESLMSDPLTLFGGGGALVLLLGYLGYKFTRRRGEERPTEGLSTTEPGMSTGAASSVFGATGGQSVDTSSSSIQTDFSQSGIGAIDADEGVDPVAEADVYMAYGRDAQAEEILLDALKTDPTRHAIHVKLLEIYAQRKNLQQFETLASELYAQTGGVGTEWEKAAALGHKLDPANPLYGGSPADAQKAAEMDTTLVIPAGAAAAAGLKDTWTMPGELGQIASAAEGGTYGETSTVVLPGTAEAKAEDATATLDFDLGGEAPAPAAEAAQEPAEVASLDFDLGGAAPEIAEPVKEPAPVQEETATLMAQAPQEATKPLTAAVDLDFKLPETEADRIADAAALQTADSDVDIDFTTSIAGIKPSGAPGVVDLEATDFGGNLLQSLTGMEPEPVRAAPPTGPSGAALDLEKTDVGGNLLDFDFDLGEPAKAKTGATPVIDLAGINLDLNEVQPAAPAEAPAAPEAAEIAQETATKLELAHAYEEMGDKEGARELLQEVLKEGDAAQQEQARAMLAKLA